MKRRADREIRRTVTQCGEFAIGITLRKRRARMEVNCERAATSFRNKLRPDVGALAKGKRRTNGD